MSEFMLIKIFNINVNKYGDCNQISCLIVCVIMNYFRVTCTPSVSFYLTFKVMTQELKKQLNNLNHSKKIIVLD